MQVSRKIVQMANSITRKYSSRIRPNVLQRMYEELEEIGITTGMLTNRRETGHQSWYATCEWYLNGEIIDNSWYSYSVYEGGDTEKNEYNIRFT